MAIRMPEWARGQALIWLALLSPCAVLASAQDQTGRQFGTKTGQAVAEIIEQGEEVALLPAVQTLQSLLNDDGLNPYERSTIYQMLGSYQYELDQIPEALQSFTNAKQNGGLLPSEVLALDLSVAQLLLADEQYAKGAAALENWVKATGNAETKYLDLIIQGWIQAGEYAKALAWARKISSQSREHFDLMNYLYHQLEMHDQQSELVKDMIELWPEDLLLWDVWKSLLVKAGRNEDAFEVNKIQYLSGITTEEADILKVVQYYSYYDMPFQAARILEKELNSGRVSKSTERLIQLSDLFRQAREYERAIPVLKTAAQFGNSAKIYEGLGEALYHQNRCEEAETAFKKAMSLGYQTGKAWMLIANCRYEKAQKEERPDCDNTTPEERAKSAKIITNKSAIDAFRKVPVSSGEYDAAQKWRTFVEDENDAIENRCKFIDEITIEVCYLKIELAYKAMLFTREFYLAPEDAHCLEYKEAFDREYRQFAN